MDCAQLLRYLLLHAEDEKICEIISTPLFLWSLNGARKLLYYKKMHQVTCIDRFSLSINYIEIINYTTFLFSLLAKNRFFQFLEQLSIKINQQTRNGKCIVRFLLFYFLILDWKILIQDFQNEIQYLNRR